MPDVSVYLELCEILGISLNEFFAGEDIEIDNIEKQLKNQYTEVSTTDIGETILQHLLNIDQVAYIRFASVYKDFSDIESFFKELEALKSSVRSHE